MHISRQRELEQKLGPVESFNVECSSCGKSFQIRLRSKKFDPNKKYYCCRSCSNRRYPSEKTKLKISETIKENYQNSICTKENTNVDSLKNNIELKRSSFFKDSIHLSWNNKSMYLRSGLELDYAKYLDSLRVDYDVEALRIPYFDSEKDKFRIAKPDFYISDTNTVVEIKSEFTYNYDNMKCRAKEYLNRKYKFVLVLDHKEYKVENIEDLPKQNKKFTIDILNE